MDLIVPCQYEWDGDCKITDVPSIHEPILLRGSRHPIPVTNVDPKYQDLEWTRRDSNPGQRLRRPSGYPNYPTDPGKRDGREGIKGLPVTSLARGW